MKPQTKPFLTGMGAEEDVMGIRIVYFEKAVADSILTAALSVYPRETILLLQGKKSGDEIRLNSILIPPLATYGRGFSSYLGTMLPWDLTIMGVAHSHPSGNPHPSTHDLNHFRGRIMVITAYPYNDYRNLAAYDREGNTIPHEIVPDETPQQL
jgi:proteasome lid subunit RPN8/RPN11